MSEKVAIFEMNQQAVTLLMENGPGGMDVHAYIMQQPEPEVPSIRVCYEIWDADAEEIDSGIEGPDEGHPMQPDAEEMLEGITPVALAVKFLQGHYASSASASFFHPGVWYETEPSTDYHTGEISRNSFHLAGFTDEEERQVYQAIIGK